MASAQFVEHFAGRACPSVNDIIHPLPDSLVDVGAGRGIEQLLIGLRSLDDGLGLAVDGKDHRPLALLHLLEKFSGFAPESCQRLNVLREIEHRGRLPLECST